MRPQLAFAFIFVTVLLDSIGFGIIMPVVPQLIMDVSGDTLTSAARDVSLEVLDAAGAVVRRHTNRETPVPPVAARAILMARSFASDPVQTMIAWLRS